MNLGLQKYKLRRILAKANPHLKSLIWLPVGIFGDETDDWEDLLDPDLTFPENIDEMKQRFPRVLWKVPKKRPSPNKPTWKKEMHDCAGQDHRGHFEAYDILIKPHRVSSNGKTYLHGRIQLTLDKRLIGREAKVTVFVRNAYDDLGNMISPEEQARRGPFWRQSVHE